MEKNLKNRKIKRTFVKVIFLGGKSMIREFWVENYRSIRDRQVLNFVTKGPESELVVKVPDGTYLYKLGILYGANASGKSNILLSLDEVFHVLVTSNTNVNQKIDKVYPFILTKEKPVKMHVSFYANDIRYDYDVEFTEQYILKEILYYYPNTSKALFYERTFIGEGVQSDIKFGASLRLQTKTQDSIIENTLNNHSVLSVCSKNSFKEDIKPFTTLSNWIKKYHHTVDYNNSSIMYQLKNAFNDERKHKFYNIMLQKADLNIMTFKMVLEDRKISQELRESINDYDFPGIVREELLYPKKLSAIFTNSSEDGNFEVPLELQSKGTLMFLNIIETLYDLISDSHVYLIDELGEDLHCDLLMYFLNVFLYNSNNSQLIMTSQETSLLSQELLNENRGVVWFVEKNRERASSEYSRGDSFGLHKNLSLYNSYKIGRLGAKPEFGSIFIDLD